MQDQLLDVGHDLDLFFSRLATIRNKSPHVHGLHPYPAKFIPQIPRALIGKFTAKGHVVLDPMCGSGTTLVEAALEGRRAIGVDINPIAVLVSTAKTTRLRPIEEESLVELAKRLARMSERLKQSKDSLTSLLPEVDLPQFRNRELWFDGLALRELAFAKREILDLPSDGARVVALCAFSAMVVPLSNQESETQWRAKPREIPRGTVTGRLAAKISDSVTRLQELQSLDPEAAMACEGDARRLPLREASIDAVVTSPPYANTHDYYLYNKLRMFWLGYDVSRVQDAEIGSRNRHSDKKESVSAYLTSMEDVLREISRVLKDEGIAVLVVADALIRGVVYSMDELLRAAALQVGLRLQEAYQFEHGPFNASFQRGFGRVSDKKTHVLAFSKD